MKRKKLLLFSILLSGLCLLAYSQEPPKLIFTEMAMPGPGTAHYYELTNVETEDTVDLREFIVKHYGWWHTYPGGANHDRVNIPLRFYLSEEEAMLLPGESFVICGVWEGEQDDGAPIHRERLVEKADLYWFANEASNPDLAEGEDTVSSAIWFLRNPQGDEGKMLWWRSSETDSMVVDAFNNWLDPANNRTYRWTPPPVAGVEEANRTHTFIRKANITQGTDWDGFDGARGNDLSDSEWLPIPYDPENQWNPVVFSTVGTHGVFDIQMTPVLAGISIDDAAGTITVPWGVRKGTWDVTNNRSQGIFDAIEWGDGMAWNYQEHGDTASSACQTGDTLNIFAVGNTLIQKSYEVIVSDAAADNALVLPKREFDDEFYMSWFHGASFGPGYDNSPTPLEDRRMLQPYTVSEDIPGMDTIGNVPYATRTDSLLKYLEMAPNATAEFIFVDGEDRVDVMDGDILRITAEDNSTKDYYLSVEDIAKSTNAELSAITWPDIPFELEGWKGDTIPGFSSTIFSYTITVPFGINNVPALVPFRTNLNSYMTIDRATTLVGEREDRTTTITVQSQDTTQADGRMNVYNITFEMEKLEEHLQPYHATPVISEIVWRICGAEATFFEIANVGNQPMNLENYLFQLAAAAGTPAEVLAMNATADSLDWVTRYRKYIPGFKHGTLEEWKVAPGIMKPDPDVDPIVEPNGTFVMGRYNGDQFNPENPGVHMNKPEIVRIHWSQFLENHHGEMGFNYNHSIPFCWRTVSTMVFKILNPAVLEGTKPATDPADFELVDLWGNFTQDADWVVGGYKSENAHGWRRKAHYWQPNLEQNGGWGTTFEDSDWIVTDTRWPEINYSNDIMIADLGNFSHDPITIFMSTVGSVAYLVDPGFEGDLTIQGVVTGSTVDDVIGNIIPADTGQDLTILSASTGAMLDAAAAVTDGDTLMVVSADMVNTTKYVLQVAAGGLDSDATLVAKDGSGLTVTIDGSMGTVTGIPYGTPVSDILAMVTYPETAVLNVVDGDNNLVPLQILNPDTLLVQTSLLGELYFEVVAQNQEDVITYELVLDIAASDAWITSNVYTVSQENLVISSVPEDVIVRIMMENLIPSGNATIEILDKAEMKRDSGYVVKDDIIRVTSEDGNVMVDYSLRFQGQALRTAAFVTSEVYTVDEGNMEISEVPFDTDAAVVVGNLKPAAGAVMMLTDASGNAKTEGAVVSGDKVVVTAEDGETEASYTVDVLVSARDLNGKSISIYPNPASEVLYLSGVPAGSTVHMTSITGQKVRVLEVNTEPYRIAVDDLANGYYIINVVDSDQNSTLFRFVKH